MYTNTSLDFHLLPTTGLKPRHLPSVPRPPPLPLVSQVMASAVSRPPGQRPWHQFGLPPPSSPNPVSPPEVTSEGLQSVSLTRPLCTSPLPPPDLRPHRNAVPAGPSVSSLTLPRPMCIQQHKKSFQNTDRIMSFSCLKDFMISHCLLEEIKLVLLCFHRAPT